MDRTPEDPAGDPLFDPRRHEPLVETAWDEAEAAIGEVVADTDARFDPVRFWPTHPMEDYGRDGATSLYLGAAGTIWALDHLAGVGATGSRRYTVDVLDRMLARNRQELRHAYYPDAPSYLMGDVGVKASYG